MSQGSQSHRSIHDNTTEVELQPSKTTQAIAIPEDNNAVSLEPSQAESSNGRPLTSHSATSERLRSSFNQATDTPVRGMESANPSVQLNSAGASLVEDVRLERGAAPAPQRQSGQNRIGEIERLSPQIERMLLDKIRDKMMYELGVTKESVTGISISDTETRTFRFHFGSAVNETVELGWLTEMGIKKAARIEQAFRDAWPEDRKWSKAYVVESDGRSPAVLAHWSSVGKVYQDDLKAIYQNRVNLPPANPLYPGYEGLWHSWCYAARAALKERRERMPLTDMGGGEIPASRYRPRGKIIYCSSNSQKKGDQHHPINLLAWALSYDEPFSKSCHDQNSFRVGYSASFFSPNFRGGCNVPGGHPEQHAIHWQIRYFRPISDYTCSDMDCLLSKRQAATIRHGSEAICLGERRARVSFRVLRGTPGLFSILSLSDDWMPIGKKDFQNIDKVKASWERYGLMARERAIPITHYLFEICRIFERCMDAWGETLDAIDGLVHVDLNDFDDQSRVEDLMFDKSFNRSKDYFVALQLLRIVDEWLDEIVPSVKELQKDPSLGHPSFCAAAARENFNAAIRSIDERAGAVQRRVRKKVEEINSLRDGLFNATSLRESTKAMALNQAIYVFTIVTVLFTPVSFLATFWALPFLNNPTEGSDVVPEPSAFRNSFIVMPLLTYALVIGVAWLVGQRNSTNALLDLLRELWEFLRLLMRFAWSLLPWMPRRGNGRSPYSSSDSLEA